MGLELASTVGSRPGFFNRGLTIACLNAAGTTPSVILLLIIVRTGCPMLKGKSSMKRRAGRISRGEPDGFISLSISSNNCKDTGSKETNIFVQEMETAGSGPDAEIRALVFSTLSMKNFKKSSQSTEDGSEHTGCVD